MIHRWLVVEVHASDEDAVRDVARRIDRTFSSIAPGAAFVTVTAIDTDEPVTAGVHRASTTAGTEAS